MMNFATLILLYFSLTKNFDLTNLTFLLKANIKNTNLEKKNTPNSSSSQQTTLAIQQSGNLVSCVDAAGLAADCTFCVDPVSPERKTFAAVGWLLDAAAVLAVVMAVAQPFVAVGSSVSKGVVVKLRCFSGLEDVGHWRVVWTEYSFGLAVSFVSPLIVVEAPVVVVVVMFAFEMRLIEKTFVGEAFAAFEVAFETFEVVFETFEVAFEVPFVLQLQQSNRQQLCID